MLEYAEENEDSELVRTVFSPLLVLSWCYGLAMQGRWILLDLSRRISVPCPVVSVGNITVGGTGKTPLVALLAQRLAAMNVSVGVVSHGYGRAMGDGFVLMRGAMPSAELARRAGDEAVLLSRVLPRVPIASGKSKGHSLQRLWHKSRPQMILVDDAFQTIRLERDLDVVAVDAVNPWGRGYLLPRGRLREPKESLSRADLVVLTRCNQAEGLEVLTAEVRKLTRAPVVMAEHVLGGVWRPDTWQKLPDSFLAGKSVYAFSGIGHPGSFEQTLSELGASVMGARRFGDHHFFSVADIDRVDGAASRLGAEFLVTTDKDAVRLPGGALARAGVRMLAVGAAVRIKEGAETLDALLMGVLAGRKSRRIWTGSGHLR